MHIQLEKAKRSVQQKLSKKEAHKCQFDNAATTHQRQVTTHTMMIVNKRTLAMFALLLGSTLAVEEFGDVEFIADFPEDEFFWGSRLLDGSMSVAPKPSAKPPTPEPPSAKPPSGTPPTPAPVAPPPLPTEAPPVPTEAPPTVSYTVFLL